MIAVLNFSHETDPHLTYHIDPHMSCTEWGTDRPRTSIPNRLLDDVAENYSGLNSSIDQLADWKLTQINLIQTRQNLTIKF